MCPHCLVTGLAVGAPLLLTFHWYLSSLRARVLGSEVGLVIVCKLVVFADAAGLFFNPRSAI